jgi:hypothetical protein
MLEYYNIINKYSHEKINSNQESESGTRFYVIITTFAENS